MPSTDIYTLSLHDALPICTSKTAAPAPRGAVHARARRRLARGHLPTGTSWRPFAGSSVELDDQQVRVAVIVHIDVVEVARGEQDRKSTRLNSSHSQISYAVHRHLHPFPTRRSSDLYFQNSRSSASRGSSCTRAASPCSRTSSNRDIVAAFRGQFSGTRRPAGQGRRHCAHRRSRGRQGRARSEEHTSELQSQSNLVCRPPTSTPFPYTTLFRSVLPKQPLQRLAGQFMHARGVALLEDIFQPGHRGGLSRAVQWNSTTSRSGSPSLCTST